MAIRKPQAPARKRKDPNAAIMGRRGGKARLATMTAKERAESARHAANVRWNNE